MNLKHTTNEQTYLIVFYKPYEWEKLGALQAEVPWSMLFSSEVMGLIKTNNEFKFLSPLSEYLQ